MDYSSLIDIIRCNVTFYNLSDYYNGIVDDINKILANDIIDIIRIKNGFNKEYVKYITNDKYHSEFLPDGYLDIKMNVIASNAIKELIGEIQFLFLPMLDSQKLDDEFYEIKRIKEMLDI